MYLLPTPWLIQLLVFIVAFFLGAFFFVPAVPAADWAALADCHVVGGCADFFLDFALGIFIVARTMKIRQLT